MPKTKRAAPKCTVQYKKIETVKLPRCIHDFNVNKVLWHVYIFLLDLFVVNRIAFSPYTKDMATNLI